MHLRLEWLYTETIIKEGSVMLGTPKREVRGSKITTSMLCFPQNNGMTEKVLTLMLRIIIIM